MACIMPGSLPSSLPAPPNAPMPVRGIPIGLPPVRTRVQKRVRIAEPEPKVVETIDLTTPRTATAPATPYYFNVLVKVDRTILEKFIPRVLLDLHEFHIFSAIMPYVDDHDIDQTEVPDLEVLVSYQRGDQWCSVEVAPGYWRDREGFLDYIDAFLGHLKEDCCDLMKQLARCGVIMPMDDAP